MFFAACLLYNVLRVLKDRTQGEDGIELNNADSRQPAGSLRISKGVIAAIAKTAALEIQGVASLSEHDIGKGVFSKSFRKKTLRVVLSDDFAEIDISVILEFGASIPDVCAEVQSAIKDSIQTMTGIAVSKVNVTVTGIHFSTEGGNAGVQ